METKICINNECFDVKATKFIFDVTLRKWETVYILSDNTEFIFNKLSMPLNSDLIAVNKIGTFNIGYTDLQIKENYVSFRPTYCMFTQ